MKWIALFLIVVSLMGVTSVWAHSSIKRTLPADGTAFTDSPETIEVWFSDPVIPDTGHITLTHSSSGVIETLSVHVDEADRTHLIADLPADLPDDTYIVTVSAIATDGHRSTSSFVFWIRPTAARPSASYTAVVIFAAMLLGVIGGGYFWVSKETRSSDKLILTRPDETDDYFKLP